MKHRGRRPNVSKKRKVPKAVKAYVKKTVTDKFVTKQICSVAIGGAASNVGLVENASYPVSISNNPNVNREARTSNKILMTDYTCRIDYYNISTDAPTILRHIMVYDKGCEGVSAATFLTQMTSSINNLFEDTLAVPANAPLWPFNMDHLGKGSDHRFELLHDKTMAINPFSGSQPIHKSEIVRKKWKNGKKVVFDDLNPLVFGPTAITSGIIWHIFLVDEVSGFMDMNITWDIRFIDSD